MCGSRSVSIVLYTTSLNTIPSSSAPFVPTSSWLNLPSSSPLTFYFMLYHSSLLTFIHLLASFSCGHYLTRICMFSFVRMSLLSGQHSAPCMAFVTLTSYVPHLMAYSVRCQCLHSWIQNALKERLHAHWIKSLLG